MASRPQKHTNTAVRPHRTQKLMNMVALQHLKQKLKHTSMAALPPNLLPASLCNATSRTVTVLQGI